MVYPGISGSNGAAGDRTLLVFHLGVSVQEGMLLAHFFTRRVFGSELPVSSFWYCLEKSTFSGPQLMEEKFGVTGFPACSDHSHENRRELIHS